MISTELFARVRNEDMGNSTNTRLLLVLPLLTLLLTSCVSLPNPFSDNGGFEVDAQVGKTNEKVTGVKTDELVIGNKKTNTAEYVVEDSKYGTIKATTVKVDEQVPAWIWLLAILGWLLPSPQDIWNGLGKLAYSIKKFIKD